MDCFAYGSLMFEDVMVAVTGQTYSRSPARLAGFARYRIAQESYPGIIASERDCVEGFLYRQIDPAALCLLDRFEGEYYQRVTVQVAVGSTTVPAETYVLRREFTHLLTRELWQRDVFQKRHLADFLARYKGFASGR